MDAESLAQVKQVVTTAVSGAEEKLRGEMAALGTSLRKEFDDKLTEKFKEAERHSDEKFKEAERHSGVLFEESLRRIDLVIEGIQFLRDQILNLDAKIEHESLETRALIQLSYRQLQDRVETLEQRVQIIEKRLGLST